MFGSGSNLLQSPTIRFALSPDAKHLISFCLLCVCVCVRTVIRQFCLIVRCQLMSLEMYVLLMI